MTTLLNKQPLFIHLSSLTTSRGLYEHAAYDQVRKDHGYCVDDVARAFVLLCHQANKDLEMESLQHVYLDFLLDAISSDGKCHNRMNVDGHWTDTANVEDCWGRAIWGLGVGAVYGADRTMRARSLEGFHALTKNLSSNRMSLVFAALGAGEVLLMNPTEEGAREVLLAVQGLLIPCDIGSGWIWPEPRLRYSNGSVVEAAILGGWALRDMKLMQDGIHMLRFLVEVETRNGHFSLTPPQGRGPMDREPAFDQQPLEVAALADACARAWEFTGNPRWPHEVKRAWDWFLGSNDLGVRMFDPLTGGGYDGLTANGPNLNQGAESTISMLSTAQRAMELQAFFEVA